MVRRALRVALALLVVLIGAVVVGGLWLRGRGLPARTGSHELPGLSAAVTVRFDRFAVPHVSAESERDLMAALGWLHANDRLTQMELGRRAAFGRLAEIAGEAAVETDVYFRTLRLRQAAETMWSEASPESRRWLEGYADGVNAWLTQRGSDLPPELIILGVEPEPWTPLDSIAFAFLMARDLSFWDDRPEEARFEWLRAFGPEAVRDLLGQSDLHLPPAIVELAAEGGRPTQPSAEGARDFEPSAKGARDFEPDPPGSNNWVVGGSRTASGRPVIANDPHLGLYLPAVWYQAQLRAPGYSAAGMTLPGAPGVVLGRGEDVAWAFTNTMLDDHDLLFEQLDDAGERYRRGDRWLPLENRPETIEVRGGDRRKIVLRETAEGPLLPADDERGLPARTLLWTAHLGGDPIATLRGLARATNEDGLLVALESYVCPAQNLVAAFSGGELINTILGAVPERRLGDGRLPSPGWTGEYGWTGLRPRATNPTSREGRDGLLVTANADVRPPGYGPALVADFFPPYREDRIRQRLLASSSWDLDSTAELQLDVVSIYARQVVTALADTPVAGDAVRARDALVGWNGEMTERGPAALYIVVERELLRRIFADEASASGVPPFSSRSRLDRLLSGEMSPRWWDDVATPAVEDRHAIVQQALASAWHEVVGRWGQSPSDWDYGWIHGLTLRHRLDGVPVLGAWLRRGPFPVPGSATTVAAFGARWKGERQAVTYGPSMRFVVDLGEPGRSWAALPGGQSGHPADANYDDRLPDFLAGKLQPAAFHEDEIDATSINQLRLLPSTATQVH